MNYGDSTGFRVFYANASGTGFTQSYTLAWSATNVWVGDFNGDGKDDFMINYGDTTGFRVLYANAAGNGFAQNYTLAWSPTTVYVGDFNGDGKDDFALNYGDATGWRFVYSTGSNNFAQLHTRPGGVTPLTVDDFNGDGRDDLLLNYGDATGWRAVYSLGTSFKQYWTRSWGSTTARAGDFDGDGSADFAVHYGDSRGFRFLYGSGSGEGSWPESCAEIRDIDASNGDGEYLIEIEGHEVVVTCVDMASTPKEYLTLPNTGSANYSAYGTGQNTSTPAVRTEYTKVRLNPVDLTVDITDKRFSTSNGKWAQFGWSYHYEWDYAHAADCRSPWSQTGRANVDLTGTPFAVEQDQFVVWGSEPAGTVTYSAGDQVVELTGGGYCGDHRPEGTQLQLRWAD
ncbi:GON domain-containing protein [Nannocystis pusilla]|uniref:GON domain-containing protein n=1 Tax=Nannocystis pusilla TaxID=889268 RepID=A0A9X3J1K5_9BACT|nr:GON domain-containing protein [Nannocystis pusilla]